MGRVFGTRAACEQAALYSDKPEITPAYPDLPRQLLEMIYMGDQVTVSRRALSYVVVLGGYSIHADEQSVFKWLRHNWGDKLDSTQFHIALTLICERVRHEISDHERKLREAEREQARAELSTWGPGPDLSDFFGR